MVELMVENSGRLMGSYTVHFMRANLREYKGEYSK